MSVPLSPDPDVISRATDQGIVAEGTSPDDHHLVARDGVAARQGKVLVATSLGCIMTCI
jgi:hypothetical protein